MRAARAGRRIVMRPTEHGFVGPLAGELEEYIRFKASMGRHGATLCFVKLGSAFCAVFFRSVGSGFSAGCAVSAAACLRCVGYLVMRACSLR